ncbi:MAG TPA: EsaB/YukD family protein [Candidatus Angelobacter sp.]|jgi:hypothetical protein|nr:EsaB/YukD family protein [Candidatus Angelobacter sp.]
MKFHIQVPEGNNFPVEFPSNLPAEVLLKEFIADENLAIHPREYSKWHLRNPAGQNLDLKKSLEHNGIHDGQILHLIHAVVDPVSPVSKPNESGGLKRCENGHYYDPVKFPKGCPYDGVASIELGGDKRSIKIGAAQPGDRTMPANARGKTAQTDPDTDPITKYYSPGGVSQRIDPVVGWLVCIHGPDKGRDYRIRSQNNTVGRSQDMHICISGDEQISRERHTIITFEPQRNTFHLSPGEGRSLVYLNGEALLTHKELKPYDEILLGATKLLFIPFCGDRFKWS